MRNEIEEMIIERVATRLVTSKVNVNYSHIKLVVKEVFSDPEYVIKIIRNDMPTGHFTSLDAAVTAAEEKVKKFREDLELIEELSASLPPHKRAAFKAAVASLVADP